MFLSAPLAHFRPPGLSQVNLSHREPMKYLTADQAFGDFGPVELGSSVQTL